MYRYKSQPASGRSTFELLYRRHMPALMAYVNWHIPSREDAEDLLVDVFTAALERSADLELMDEREQLNWLRRVAHNKMVDFYRSRNRHPLTSLEAEESDFEDNAQTPEQAVLLQEELRWLSTHLQRLPRSQQEIVRLRFLSGLRCTEIAQLLNKSEGSVRMLLTRALKGLRSVYEQQKEKRDR